jgi:hypothetical protein
MTAQQAWALEAMAGRDELLRQGQHRVLLALQDAEVGVTVPRNHLPLAYRPEQRSIVQPVHDAVARQQVTREADEL